MQVKTELQKAKAQVEAMNNASSLEDFEETWKQYLFRLERVWSKSKDRYKRYPKWSGWSAPYSTARKNDPLLVYLRNARNADEHTEQEIADKLPSGIGIGASDGGALYIEELAIIGGRITELKGSSNMKVEFVPGRLRLRDVTNKGILYLVPTSHLGKEVDTTDIISIARLGLSYYESFCSAAIKEFESQAIDANQM